MALMFVMQVMCFGCFWNTSYKFEMGNGPVTDNEYSHKTVHQETFDR